MNNLHDVLLTCKKISNDIENLMKQSTYAEYDDLSGLEINYTDPDQLFLLDELRGILEKLGYANNSIQYIKMPIKHIDTLQLNSRGRYATEHKEYTCGSTIEVYIYDDYRECFRWLKTSVEHNNKGYYLVRYPELPMDGLKVRERERL